MFPAINTYCDERVKEFDSITRERKILLEKIALYLAAKKRAELPLNLLYICTHNSRRSQFGQIWATIASRYYKVPSVNAFSGGTDTTAFHLNAIEALTRSGFRIRSLKSGENSVYEVQYDDQQTPVLCFSKLFNDPVNPGENFAAVMTCGEAEENCPFIPNVDLRIATTYEDPKSSDHTAEQRATYDERCRQIARETLYLFSKLKH